MSARTVALVALGVALTAGLTACGGDEATPPSADGPSVAPTSPSPSPSSSPSRTATATAKPVADKGCPVTAATLREALQEKLGGDPLPQGLRISKVECYRDWAIATRENPTSDSEIESFRYESGSWRSFTGGSGGYCEGVPAKIKKHFQTAGYEGCS